MPEPKEPTIDDAPLRMHSVDDQTDYLIPASGLELARNIWGDDKKRSSVEDKVTEGIIFPDEVGRYSFTKDTIILSLITTGQEIVIPKSYFPKSEK